MRFGCVVRALVVSLLVVDGAIAQEKRVYLAPDDHTDYFWTADEATYRQAFLDTLDYYLDQADASANEPSDFQGRWNCDGSLWMWTYERNRTPTQFARLVERIRDGHVSVPLNPLAVSLGAAPAEAVLRGMYYPGSVERRFGVRFPLAYTMENQTQPLGLSSLWAGAGARYSWKGICGCDTPVVDAWDREHDLYWSRGLDGQGVLMKWNSQLTSSNQAMGGYAEAYDTYGVVDYVTDQATGNGFRDRYPYDVIGCFGKGWDDLQTLTDVFPLAARELTRPDRRVIVSNETDYFEDLLATYAESQIPSVTASYGNDWEIYVASLPEVSARLKRAVERLRAAEAMASAVSLVNPCFTSGREAARDQAWMNLGLYFEHDFGMDARSGTIVDERIAWQKRLVEEIEAYVDALHGDAAAALGAAIARTGAGPRFLVFNPLAWSRTDVADLPVLPQSPFHVVDLVTGAEVPSQVVTVDGAGKTRVIVHDVPSLGYKVLEIRSGVGPGVPPGDAVSATNTVLENSRHRVTVASRGAITSWIDKARGGREMVRAVLGRQMNDLGGFGGHVRVESVGPSSATLVATTTSPWRRTTRVTLYRDLDRVDVVNDIEQRLPAETIEWGFGYNLDGADVWHEEVGAILRARLTTDGGHYAPRNARYDALTLGHFADVGGAGPGFTLSNGDAYFMRLGDSTTSSLDAATPLLGVMAHYYKGLPDQGGDLRFRYRFALRARDAYDPVAAMRFALEHQNPLVAAPVQGGGPLPEASHSFVTVSSPSTLLWGVKPSEEGIGRGLAVRLWNLSGSFVSTWISFAAGPATGASAVTHIETPTGRAQIAPDGSVRVALAAGQMGTVVARLEERSPIVSPTLRLSKSGSAVVLAWDATGQACYSLVRSSAATLGAAQRVYEGPALQATDATSDPTTPLTFYVVE